MTFATLRQTASRVVALATGGFAVTVRRFTVEGAWTGAAFRAVVLAMLVLPSQTFGRVEDDHTRRDPSVLTPGAFGRPEFDGQKFPTRSAFFFATDNTDPEKPSSGIPGSVSLLALKLKPGTKPETLFEAVEKLKKAEPAKQLEAARALATLLGPEGVKAFTDEKTKQLDAPKLLQALTLLASDDDLKKAKDGLLGRRDELLLKELGRLQATPPPAPPANPTTGSPPAPDPNGGSGGVPPAPEPKDPGTPSPGPGDGVGNGTGNGNGNGNGNGLGGDPPIVPPGDGLGVGQDLFNPFNPNQDLLNEIQRLQNELENAKDDAEEARRNAKNNKDKDPGLPKNGDGQQQPLPLPQPGGGGAPSLTRQKLEVPPVEIAKPVAAPAFQMPPPMGEATLSGDAVDKLSGGGLPPTPQPGTTFDKLMQETAALRESGMQVLQSIYARLASVVKSPELTTPVTNAQGARTVGEVLKAPNLFNRPPGGGPQALPERYEGSAGNIASKAPSTGGLLSPLPGGSKLRPPPSIGSTVSRRQASSRTATGRR